MNRDKSKKCDVMRQILGVCSKNAKIKLLECSLKIGVKDIETSCYNAQPWMTRNKAEEAIPTIK